MSWNFGANLHLVFSVATHFHQKSATFVAKSSQKVANFYRQSLLNKRRFLGKINTFWRDFFLPELKIFQNFSENEKIFLKISSHFSEKSLF